MQDLLVMIAYEKRTGKTIDQKDVEAGKIQLHEILTQEDFDNAGKESEFLSYMFKECLILFLLPVLVKLPPHFFE